MSHPPTLSAGRSAAIGRSTPGRLRRGAGVVALVFCLAFVAPSEAAARGTAARKLGRSVANLTLGVLAVPGQVVRTSKQSGPFVGATWGLTKGVAFMVATEAVGLFELVTAPFETPPDYEPILKPEFPWQYLTQDPEPRRPRPPSRPSGRSTR